MLLLIAFGLGETAGKIALPIMLANILGMAFCFYIYKHFDHSETKETKTEE